MSEGWFLLNSTILVGLHALDAWTDVHCARGGAVEVNPLARRLIKTDRDRVAFKAVAISVLLVFILGLSQWRPALALPLFLLHHLMTGAVGLNNAAIWRRLSR